MRRPVAVLTSVLLFATTARAAIYDTPIAIDDEEDLYDLEQRGDISADALETLLELFRDGVDLNTGSRDELYDLPGLSYQEVDAIIAYRKAKGRIEDPAELVGAGAITGDQLIEIAPFIRIDAAGARLPVSGKVRLAAAASPTDNIPPPAIFLGRIKGPWDLSAGVMLASTRRSVATPRYDLAAPLVPGSVGPPDALLTDGFGYHLHVPRAFLQWHSGTRRVVAGTFSVGFGERLTLDNTRRATPHGFYLTDNFIRPTDLSRTCKISGGDPISGGCAAGEKNLYVTSDFDWQEPFRGVAASLEDLPLGGEVSASAFGFLSYQSRSIYQYELYDRRECADPHDPNDKLCKAPTIFLNEGTPSNPSVGIPPTKLIYATLPYLYDELAAGGHVELHPGYRYRVGLTGYGANPTFHANTQPLALDFQEWSRTPGGGGYGALGVDGQATFGLFNLNLEATRTFDRSVGNKGGGFGLVQRTTWSPKGHELELSLRYYDDHFANPLARPVSAPDELDGQRARNELGARLRYFGRPSRDWQVTARADFWVLPFARLDYLSPDRLAAGERPGVIEPAGVANLYARARVDFVGWTAFTPSLWFDVRNRNLAQSQHGGCASGTVVLVEGAPYLCNGDLYRIAARLDFRPLGRLLEVATQAWSTWSDDRRYPDRFRQDVMVWGEVRSQPFDQLSLRLKSRYLFQDISDNTYLEQSLWTFLEAAWSPTKGTRLALRYDVYLWLDRRDSTLSRVPNPEHRFFLDLRTSF